MCSQANVIEFVFVFDVHLMCSLCIWVVAFLTRGNGTEDGIFGIGTRWVPCGNTWGSLVFFYQGKLQKHQAFEAEVQANSGAIVKLDETGNLMISEGHFASETIRVSRNSSWSESLMYRSRVGGSSACPRNLQTRYYYDWEHYWKTVYVMRNSILGVEWVSICSYFKEDCFHVN